MPCYHPLRAWQPLAGGELLFKPLGDPARHRQLNLPCGQCIGCRLTRSLEWATRCMHEAQLHNRNAFVTLTYDDAHIPNTPGLRHRDFQLFMKRLRRRTTVFDLTLWTHVPRYYMAGEYGDLNDRPHFHACLFGVDFPDKQHWKTTPGGFRLYRSKLLEELWADRKGQTLGHSTTGSVTFESAAYVARYCTKKITGPKAAAHYERMDPFTGEITRLNPEYTKMSLKPGIGDPWFNKFFHSDVADRDEITLPGGRKTKVPKRYDELQKRTDTWAIEYTKYVRMLDARTNTDDTTTERLAVREHVATARHNLKQRTL